MRSYHVETPGGVDGIVLRHAPTPEPGPAEIVVRVRAASLNKRDAMILDGSYPLPAKPGVVPVSDGAGEVVAVGPEVTRFRLGDRVMGGYWPRWLGGRLEPALIDQLGCTMDGMLTEYAVLDEQAAVAVPEHLSWAEAATLPCAALTAWTSLTGGEPLRPGDTVLTLGTGAVSLFALQFAKAMGHRVIVTTSSDAKAERLRALGADHVVNYAADPEWGQEVRRLTGGRGADLVVETAGPASVEQSMRAAALYGQIVLLITGDQERSGITISSAAYAGSLATIRRVFVGSRADFESMNKAIEYHGIRPVIDRTFAFDEALDAYRYYLGGGSPFGKVVIEMP